jgi:hypothetical protein
MILFIIDRACAHKDYEIVDVIGSLAIFLIYWRYNSSKQFTLYHAVSLGDCTFGSPSELDNLVPRLLLHYPSSNAVSESYRELYMKVGTTVKRWYVECTCDSKPPRHDTW